MYLDLYEIKQLSYNIINYKKIINTFYNNVKLKIKKRYEYFKYSIKYISLIKKIAKENNIIINKDNDNINYIFLNNNLQETTTDISRIISIIDSYLFKAIKIDGKNTISISLKTVSYSNSLDVGFVLKRYSHDKGYRYLKYIKYYNINGDEFKLDVSNDKIKIVDIEKFYYQEDFNSIIIVGKKLTYGDKINNDFIIKVYTLIDNVICWNSFSDLKTTSYRYKENNNTISLHTVIDTIDVSKLKELNNIKDVSISITKDGIQLLENKKEPPKGDFRYSLNVPNLDKKCFVISYSFDQRCIRDKTIEINKNDLSHFAPIIKPINNVYNNNHDVIDKHHDKLLKLDRAVMDVNNRIDNLNNPNQRKFNKMINDIRLAFENIGENFNNIRLCSKVSNENIVIDADIDFKSLGICNNNYSRNFIPFN